MSELMPALVKPNGFRGLSLSSVPKPVPQRNEVLIRILKTGICGTDLHIFQWDEWAQRRLHPPLIIGHEFMGVVEAAGEDVLRTSDREIMSRVKDTSAATGAIFAGPDRVIFAARSRSSVWTATAALRATW